MDKIRGYISSLSELFQQLILERKNPPDDLLLNTKTKGQYLAASFKYAPELATNEQVLEILGLYAAPSIGEHSLIFPTTSKLVELCLKNLSSTTLIDMWNKTNDIGLCSFIINSTEIPPDLLFGKIISWIDEPSNDTTFYAHFVNIIKTPTACVVPNSAVLQIIPFLVDASPIRSSLATLVLNSFSAINKESADLITSSWLQTEHRSIHAAMNCRTILSKAPSASLNYAATLCLEFPVLFCILPPSVKGYKFLAKLTLHRVQSLYKESYRQFLEMCERSVRKISDEVYEPLSLLDSAMTGDCLDIYRLFQTDLTLDFKAATAMFARYSNWKDGKEIPIELRKEMLKVLNSPTESHFETKPREIPIENIISASEKVNQKSILALRNAITNPII
ncbi:hypothetical protein TVAG_405850 [Trichomonas vaginalis G3]|uniref:Uncharacterized protein n=1 Tax=Trichomonas vaginalis (strain ATCC PRA-98 / G3) TaxID=412133 RepID=A2DV75_TRIV3|nr:hypothetical protein TVAGG3_0630970 [Trichomonas vaginalis G3]EAY15671.1 hypothetical protein TVAG_405850 [Trichomonas vaginalis G3]KAI5504518.1 hypothetical protein TVAGG3_0630970 [Trichomonas vaginalis G3]|eukprot:XP_001327894.1 hypothetical protein [Trichomonas vaginalis G3]